MKSVRRKITVLAVLASGMLWAGGCVGQEILNTIAAAFGIVDIWV